MKKLLLIMVIIGAAMGAKAQDMQEIKLNDPDKKRGLPVMQALEQRRSTREFSREKLKLQDLSDLLWAANGINRPDGKRTAPSAINAQDIDIYVVMEEGTYLYDAKNNTLQPVAKGDHRALVEGRALGASPAPVYLLMVAEVSRFGPNATPEMSRDAIAMDGGIVSQNISIFCAGANMATVPRMSMNKDGLRSTLKFKDSQVPVINNPVGYFK